MISVVGRQFGRLLAIEESYRDGRSRTWVYCRCLCGRLAHVRVDHLKSGNTRSCGCLGLESKHANAARAIKHGECSGGKISPEWRAWSGMRDRCNNPKCRMFRYYGGRGIKISPVFDSFSVFLTEVGRRPSPKHSLDRKNNNLGYFPGNLRWATRSQQMLNRNPWKCPKHRKNK